MDARGCLLEIAPETMRSSVRRLAGDGLVIETHRTRHFRVISVDDAWWVENLRGRVGMLCNGKRVTRKRLEHNDVLSLGHDKAELWLFLDAEPVRNPTLEQKIFDSDLDAHYLVYGDWLQQQGDPLGAAIIAAANQLPVRLSSPLAVDAVELKWRMGFCTHAVFRSYALMRSWPAQLALLLAAPQGRFLRSLQINVPALSEDPASSRWATRMVRDCELPAGLTHLELGAGARIDLSDEEIRVRLPRWDGERLDQWSLG